MARPKHIDVELIIALARRGVHSAAIGEQLNAAYSTMSEFLRKRGLTFREFYPKKEKIARVKNEKVAKVRGRKPKTKKYWNEVQEQLIIEYINQPESRNRIYLQLQPALRTMVESILYRYYDTFLHLCDDQESLLNDAEIDIATKLLKFNPAKGTKAYSYFGTIIKHYFNDYFVRESKNKLETECIYDDNNQIVHDVIDDLDETPTVQELKQRVINKLNKIQTDDETLIKVIGTLKRLMLEQDLNKYYCCYVLLKDTGLSSGTIRKKLIELDFKNSLALKKSLVNLEKIKNKFNQYDAKDAFKKYYEYKSEKEKTFKIQEKKYTKRKTKSILQNT